MIEDYVRNARLIRVVDGDTLDLDIDLGFSTWMKRRVRLLGVNCPETTGDTREAGRAATGFTRIWLSDQTTFQVRTHLDKNDSFGRVLAEVWKGEDSLAAALLQAGHATPCTR